MAEYRRDIEAFLAVDEPVLLQLKVASQSGQRYRSVVRGWVKSQYIMLDRPRTEAHYVYMERRDRCVVRFVTQGKACGFESTILDWDERPHISYCLVAWPESLELVAFRKSQRIDLFVPCRVTLEGKEFEGEVRDLSLDGCRVSTAVVVANNEKVELAFTLPNGIPVERLRANIRNTHVTDAGSVFGCEFLGNQEYVQSDLAFYVAATLERPTADHKVAPRLLIVEQNQERVAQLRKAFTDKGWHVFNTPSSIEALLRLRMMPPTAVLVSQEQSDVAGVQFMDLLKAARWVETIPVYFYGPGGKPLPGGAMGHFSSDASAQEMRDEMEAALAASGPSAGIPPAR
ncbi:flagellar brake protein [Methylococcus sp. EFPC2]|uniref:flagellar brake protein n=1 Tax=Methylococcus sp. EFPC2 TaxID=2812648 RepID=UPI0019689292|nr:flagellar brake protein [Methylococcus sp. EFPC2]QSA97403.1 flagellar brake protein [Methylococcus sp. EFPC2]